MVRFEDQWNGTELEVQDGPAKSNPDGEKEDNRLCEQHV